MRRLDSLLAMVLLSGWAIGQEPPLADAEEKAAAAFRQRNWQEAAERYAALDPREHAEGAYRLGLALHHLDRLDEALVWHLRAASMHDKEPRIAATATYNVACVEARQGRSEAAFATLALAIERGFRRATQLRRDPDLQSLRDDARLLQLVHAIEDMATLVAVVVHDGVETLDFSGPVQVFTSARTTAGDPAYRVRLVAPRGGALRPQNWRASITPDFTIDDCPQPAILVIPGGDTGVLDEDPKFMQWVKDTAAHCDVVLSVCTGAYVLARAGLLDGDEATTARGSRAGLQRQYTAVRMVDRKVVDNGHIVTAAGVSSGIDGALHVVQRQLGEAPARRIADYMEYAWLPTAGVAAASATRELEAAAEPLYRTAVAAAGGSEEAALDAIAAALSAGACPTRTLTEPAFQPLRTKPRFRRLIREHARQWDTVLVTADEPGAALIIEGVVRDARGERVADAMVYAFQTDATGTYSNGSLDEANPRLFGCLRTDAMGRYRLRTIRPGHYPSPDEPVEQHVHFEVTTQDGVVHAARIGFADDPHWRGKNLPRWVAAVGKDASGRDHCRFDLTWR